MTLGQPALAFPALSRGALEERNNSDKRMLTRTPGVKLRLYED